jgi:hypothetical protein
VCGREYGRARFRNGQLEGRAAFERRRSCGPKCGQSLGGMTSGRAAREAAANHPPCPICGAPVTRREDEPLFRYRARATCGRDDCYRRHMSNRMYRGGRSRRERTPKAPKAPKAREAPKAPAVPARRVEFERFPQPAGLKSAWQPIVSADPPLPAARPAAHAAGERPPELRAAILVHPAFAAALAGVLTDSWTPFGSATVGLSPRGRG